jgi:hypothetical protein
MANQLIEPKEVEEESSTKDRASAVPHTCRFPQTGTYLTKSISTSEENRTWRNKKVDYNQSNNLFCCNYNSIAQEATATEEMSRVVPMRVPRTLIGINASEQVGTIVKEYGAWP